MPTTDLAAESCVPCRHGEGKLESKEIYTLLGELDDWEVEGNELIKRIKFKNFVRALAYVARVSDVAEKQQHHPDISFGWGYAEIRLTTHAAGGLTRNDFILAARIDAAPQLS